MSTLGSNLNNQRKTGSRCDTTLICGDQKFTAHQGILCAASEYFSCLLDGGFSESRQGEIDMTQSIGDPEILELMLEFIYSGTLNITAENFRELLDAASLLLLTGAQDLLSEYLTNSLVIGNCLEIYTLAYRYSLTKLSDLCLAIIKARMHDYFIHGGKLMDIPPEVLTNLLKENAFVHSNKSDVSKSIEEYINNIDGENGGGAKIHDIMNIARSCGFELKTNQPLKKIQNIGTGSWMSSPKKKGKAKTSNSADAEKSNEEIVIFNYNKNDDPKDKTLKSTFYGWLAKSNRWIILRSVDGMNPNDLRLIGIADSSMTFFDHSRYLQTRILCIPLSQDEIRYVQKIDLPKPPNDFTRRKYFTGFDSSCKYFTAWNQLFCAIPLVEKAEVKCSKKPTWAKMKKGDEKTVCIDIIVSYAIHRYSAQKTLWTKACEIDFPENCYKDIGALNWCAGDRKSCRILPCMDMEVVNSGGTVYLTMNASVFPNMGRTKLDCDRLTVFTLSQSGTNELKAELKFQSSQGASLCGTFLTACDGNIRVQTVGNENQWSKVQVVKEVDEAGLKTQVFKVSYFGNNQLSYTLLQKKCTLISSSSLGDPRSLTLT